MSDLWLVIAMGAGVFALRLGGLALPAVAIPSAWERALGFVPIALLTALVVIGLTGGGGTGWEGAAAAAVAAGIVLRTGTIWTCIASGLAAYWLLRLI